MQLAPQILLLKVNERILNRKFFFVTIFILPESIFPPVFGRRLQAKVAKLGERIAMDVEVSGVPDVVVSWYKDDKPIENANISSHKIQRSGSCHNLIIEKGIFSLYFLILSRNIIRYIV